MDLNLEEAILQAHEDEFKQSVDESMQYYVMMQYWELQGWTRVELSRLRDNRHAVDITYWLQENGFFDTVNYYRDGRRFLFEREEDATLFIMRWA